MSDLNVRKEVLKKGQSLTRMRLGYGTLCLGIALFFVASLVPDIVNAHPPKSVSLKYDADRKALSVTIVHSSFMPNWHYIKTVAIAIEKNGKPVASYSYKNQTGNEFTYTYEIAASPGDTLSVTAFCSMYGSRKAVIKIPG